LSGFELEENRKLVLLIDEFPQTVINIVEANKGETKDAVRFLQSNRELRINADINQKVKFIYTGSIGLNHTVATINASAFVNDLNSIEVSPLTDEEANHFIQNLIAEKSITMDNDVINYLLRKIDWLIPFHIQLAIQEIIDLSDNTKVAGKKEIDQAFDNMVATRNNNHFEHYYSRLKSQFKNEAFRYAEDLLQTTAINASITKAQIYDKAVKYEVEDRYKKILEILEYDGYINNSNTSNEYRFNSPVVRLWWQKFICN
jgi:hypothetical protein